MTAGALRRPTRRLLIGVLLLGAAVVVAFALRGRPIGPAPAPDGGQAQVTALAGERSARRLEIERQVQRNPRDGRAWALLAYEDFEAERYAAAAALFEKAIAASPKVAADPGLLCDYADALGMAQGGSLAGQPTEWIERALALKADHPKALEMAGSAAYDRRDFVQATRYWQRLRLQLADGSPHQQALDAAIERAQRFARTSLPSAR